MPVTNALHGQVALVTGSSRGIGHAIAFALGRAGACIVVNGRDQGALDDAVRELGEQEIRATSCVADVSDEAAVRAMFEAALEASGRLMCLSTMREHSRS